MLGLATGQVLNILMSILGLGLILIPLWKSRGITKAAMPPVNPQENPTPADLRWRRLAFAALLLFSLVMPSDWTQDIPARYGPRHACLGYSSMYPRIDASPKSDPPTIAPRSEPN
jgi:hypothetical protein